MNQRIVTDVVKRPKKELKKIQKQMKPDAVIMRAEGLTYSDMLKNIKVGK